jgi:hypothetical protein
MKRFTKHVLRARNSCTSYATENTDYLTAIPLINNLEIGDIFKDEDRERGDSVIDLILVVVELLERDINRLVVEAREVLELVNYRIKGN